MGHVLILDDDPADAIIVREALLEIDPTLRVESVEHADAALWRLLPGTSRRPEAERNMPDLVIVGVRRAGADGCRFVRQVRQRFEPDPPTMVVLYDQIGPDHPRPKCVDGAEFCLPKPNRYDEYKAILADALASLHGADARQPAPGCEEAISV